MKRERERERERRWGEREEGRERERERDKVGGLRERERQSAIYSSPAFVQYRLRVLHPAADEAGRWPGDSHPSSPGN